MSPRVVVAGLLLALGASAACSKKREETPPPKQTATLTTGTVGADGVRKVPIDVVMEGYSPERIPGKPGEKLILVFTRKVDGMCFEEVKTPDGKLIALPKDKPVEVPVTVPQEGEVRFACGMDMLFGVVVAEGT
jgi:plastocyanin domain-containing protein